jgi:hypothetical protein
MVALVLRFTSGLAAVDMDKLFGECEDENLGRLLANAREAADWLKSFIECAS